MAREIYYSDDEDDFFLYDERQQRQQELTVVDEILDEAGVLDPRDRATLARSHMARNLVKLYKHKKYARLTPNAEMIYQNLITEFGEFVDRYMTRPRVVSVERPSCRDMLGKPVPCARIEPEDYRLPGSRTKRAFGIGRSTVRSPRRVSLSEIRASAGRSSRSGSRRFSIRRSPRGYY